MPNWKKVITSGSDAALNSINVTNNVTALSFTGSLLGTASHAATASYVTTLNQNVLVTGSLTVGSASLGATENTLTLGARDAVGEGGQLGFNAPGGTYTSASMLDNWQNRLRILKGTNAGSTAEVASWNMHNLQMQLPAYTSTSAFPGTAAANLAVDSSGNIITVSTTGGSVFPYVGNAVITGSLTVTQPIYVPINGAMYFQGGDDAALYDINVVNTMGIYGVQDVTVGAIKLGSNGSILYGSGSKLGINTTNPSSASLTVNGNVWATSFTGSLLGTASYITASGVYGPYGSNSVISASYSLTSSYSLNPTISGSISSVDYIDFNTGSAVPAYKSGRVYWDNTDGALAVYNAEADITLQVGQESWVRVFNQTGLLITDGTPVRLIGAQGDVPKIVLAQSAQVSGSALGDNQIIGVATHDIETNSIGYVTTQGIVRGLNTNAFTDGDLLFVSSSAGVLTNVIPQAPYEVIQVGVCVKAGPGGSGIIFVFPTQPIDFGDLASAERGTYQYGDIWSYQQTGSVGIWKHGRSLSGSYGITGSLNVTGSLRLTGSLSIKDSASTLNIVGNAFGQTSLISPDGALVITPGLYGVQINGAFPDLKVNGNITTDGYLASNAIGSYLTGSLLGTASYATTASYALTSSYSTNISGTTNYISKFTGTNSLGNSVMFESGSNIGIGTTTPGYPLHINRDTTSNYIQLSGNSNKGLFATGAGLLAFDTSGNFRIYTGGVNERIIVDSTGNLGVGTLSPTAKLHIAAQGALSTDIAFKIRNSANTADIVTVLGNGNVGIGTTTPSASLDLRGDIRLASAADGANALWLLRNSINNWSLQSVNGVGEIWRVAGNSQTFYQVVTTNNGLNVTPGGNSTSAGLTVTSGSYPAATLLRVGVNTLVVTGSNVGIGTTAPTHKLHVSGSTRITGEANTSISSSLTVYGSGSAQPVFTVQGSQGELFSITDSLSGSLFSVNDISGLPILEVFSDNTTLIGNYQDPMLITTAKVVQPNTGSFMIYSVPTASYDTAFFEYSVRSGSNARAGTIMAIQSGSAVNFTETTTTDFGSTSNLRLSVVVTGSNLALTGSSATAGWTVKTIIRSI
jgi:hypothetical protein